MKPNPTIIVAALLLALSPSPGYSEIITDLEDVLKPYFKASIDSEDGVLDSEIMDANERTLNRAVDDIIEQSKQLGYRRSVLPQLMYVIGAGQERLYRCLASKNTGKDPYITYLTGVFQWQGWGYWPGEDGHGPAVGKTEEQIKEEAVGLIRQASKAGVEEATRFLKEHNLVSLAETDPMEAMFMMMTSEQLKERLRVEIDHARKVGYYESGLPMFFEACPTSRRKEIQWKLFELEDEDKTGYTSFVISVLNYEDFADEMDHGTAVVQIRKSAQKGLKDAQVWLEKHLEASNLSTTPQADGSEKSLDGNTQSPMNAGEGQQTEIGAPEQELEGNKRWSPQDVAQLDDFIDGLSMVSNLSTPRLKRNQALLIGLLNAIKEGAPIDTTTPESEGRTALHIACAMDRIEEVKWLLYHGADVNVTAEDGSTPQDCVENGGNAHAIRSLLQARGAASVTMSPSSSVPVPMREDRSDLQPMINRMAALRCREATSALYQKRLLTLLPLIRDGADVNITLPETKGNTALHYSCAIGSLSITRWLVEHGANVNAVTNKGATPLDCVGADNAQQISALLHARGAQPSATLRPSSSVPIPMREDRSDLQPMINRMAALRCREATSALYQKRLLTLLPLIRDGADVNITLPETKGNTALHYSCAIGSLSITRWLVEHGANVNAVTNKGATPLDCVGADNARQIRALLISHGAVRSR